MKVHYLACAISLCFGVAIARASPGEISIAGTKMLRDGRIWVAKGVDVVGRTAPATISGGTYAKARERFGLKEIQAITKLGTDVVRLQVSQAGTDPLSAIYSSDYVREVGEAVRLVRSSGMSVIICVDAQRPSGLDQAGMPSEATARSWATLAPTLGRDKGIVYELFNEPTSSKDGLTYSAAWEQWRVVMQSIVDQIRASGAENVILLDGLNWGRQLVGAPEIKDRYSQIAYAVHPYYDPTIANDLGRDSAFGNFSASHAVIASEWDASTTEHYGCKIDLPSYAQKTLSYLERKGIGLIFWAFDYPNTIFVGFDNSVTTYQNYDCKNGTQVSGPGEMLINEFKRR